MAEESGGSTGGGSGLGRKYAGVPLWVWTVGGTAGVAAIWLLYRSRKAAAAAAAAPGADTSGGQGLTAGGTTILPYDQGLAQQQYQDILNAIKAGQGAPSTPPGPTTPAPAPKPKGDKDQPKPKPVPKPRAAPPKPAPAPAPAPVARTPQYATVAGGTTVQQIIDRFGLSSLTMFRINNPLARIFEGGRTIGGTKAATYGVLQGTQQIRYR